MGIKFEKGRGYSLDVRFGSSMLLVALLLVLALVAVFAGGVIYIQRGYNDLAISQQVMLENSELRERITALNGELDSIMIKLDLMERWEDDMRSRENFKEINKEVREMGIGGLPQIDSELRLRDEGTNLAYNVLVNRLNHLRAKVEYNYQTHEELHTNYQLRSDLYRSTPSIYPTFGRISSPYGRRRHPLTGKQDFHYGIDLANKVGTPVYATAAGEVIKTGRTSKMGRYIRIRHDFGFETVYGHLSRIMVEKGHEVEKGQIIAKMGNTGDSTGPHLHYEVHRYNRYRNPSSYFSQEREDITLTN
jgi:murein DD-endopeptidase MepM/ murein hydrolase activator NlpD